MCWLSINKNKYMFCRTYHVVHVKHIRWRHSKGYFYCFPHEKYSCWLYCTQFAKSLAPPHCRVHSGHSAIVFVHYFMHGLLPAQLEKLEYYLIIKSGHSTAAGTITLLCTVSQGLYCRKTRVLNNIKYKAKYGGYKLLCGINLFWNIILDRNVPSNKLV